MAESFFVDDGCTFTDKAPARPGLYQELTFEYRLASPEKVYNYFRKLRSNPPDEFKLETEMIASHLVSWDIKDKDDNVVVPTTALVAKLHPSIRAQMADAVTGFKTPAGEAEAIRKN